MKNGKKKLLWFAAIGIALIAIVMTAVLLLLPSSNSVRFTLSPNKSTLEVGDTELLQIVAKGGNGSVLKPKWSSSAPAIVAVDEDGNITAVAEGNARITASVSKDGKETVASAQITVVADNGDKVAVEGAEVSEAFRNFILSQKSDNVADFPTQSKITVSDSAVNSHMIFAAGKGTGLRAKAWELSGTITKEDATKSMFMSFGVIDQNGKEQWFCILDDCMSLQRYWNWWETQYECDGDHVIRNDAAGDFFYNKRADLSFKIIVKDDVFKAYFGTGPDSLKLTWEFPLTEDTFGGFEKGSSYQLAINTVDPNNLVISNLYTKVGDEVEFAPGTMPGRGYIRYNASTETYYVPGEDDYVKDGYCYKLVTEKPESDYFEISMAVTPDTDAVQGEWSDSVTTGIGFVLEQNGQTVLFMYESKWNVHALINGKRNNTAEDVYSYNCGSSTCGVGIPEQGGSDAAVYKKAGVKVYVKLIYDHGTMWLLKSDDGVSWTKINGKPYTLERLNGNGEYTFDANKGFRLGFGTYIGGSDQHKSGSGKVQEVKVSYDKVKGTADEDVIVYNQNNDSYTILGTADGIPDGGYSVLLTKDGSVNFEMVMTVTPDTGMVTPPAGEEAWNHMQQTGIGFVLEQNGDRVLFVYDKPWDIHPYVNGYKEENCGDWALCSGNYSVVNSDVYNTAGEPVTLKLAYKGGSIYFYRQAGSAWIPINTTPYSLSELNHSEFREGTFDIQKPVNVGVGTWLGYSDGAVKIGGGTVSNVAISDVIEETPTEDNGMTLSNGVYTDVTPGNNYSYWFMDGETTGFDLQMTVTAGTDNTFGGFVVKQGDNVVLIRQKAAGQDDYINTVFNWQTGEGSNGNAWKQIAGIPRFTKGTPVTMRLTLTSGTFTLYTSDGNGGWTKLQEMTTAYLTDPTVGTNAGGANSVGCTLDANQPFQVGFATDRIEDAAGTTFTNVIYTTQEPEASGGSGGMSYADGVYTDTTPGNNYSYWFMDGETTGFDLQMTVTPGTDSTFGGFVVKQGDNVVLIRQKAAGQDDYINTVFNWQTGEGSNGNAWKQIAGIPKFTKGMPVTMRLTLTGGTFTLYTSDGNGGWLKLQEMTTAYLTDPTVGTNAGGANTVGCTLDANKPFQVGFATDRIENAAGTTFTNVIYTTKEPEASGGGVYTDTTPGNNYSYWFMDGETTGFDLQMTVTAGTDSTFGGFVVKQGDNVVLIRQKAAGQDDYINTVFNWQTGEGSNGNAWKQIAGIPRFTKGTPVTMRLTLEDGLFTLYTADGNGGWTKLQEMTTAYLTDPTVGTNAGGANSVGCTLDANKPFQVGFATDRIYDAAGTTFTNVIYTTKEPEASGGGAYTDTTPGNNYSYWFMDGETTGFDLQMTVTAGTDSTFGGFVVKQGDNVVLIRQKAAGQDDYINTVFNWQASEGSNGNAWKQIVGIPTFAKGTPVTMRLTLEDGLFTLYTADGNGGWTKLQEMTTAYLTDPTVGTNAGGANTVGCTLDANKPFKVGFATDRIYDAAGTTFTNVSFTDNTVNKIGAGTASNVASADQSVAVRNATIAVLPKSLPEVMEEQEKQ